MKEIYTQRQKERSLGTDASNNDASGLELLKLESSNFAYR